MSWNLIPIGISVLSIMAFVVTSHYAAWGKPHNPLIVQYIPWYSWVLLLVGTLSYIWNIALTRKRRG